MNRRRARNARPRTSRIARRRASFTVLSVIAVALVAVYFSATALEDSLTTPHITAGPLATFKEKDDAGRPDSGHSDVDVARANELLATLPVKGRAPKTGYGRESQFGRAWIDIDRNGCSTRNDILARDLNVTRVARDGCVVLAGSLTDPYSGTHIDFVHGEFSSQRVQIDHVVALSDAWQKGAQQLSAEQRVAFANDPLNLLAVDGPTNSAKGDSDAATWLPPNHAFRCEYVSRQISVKATHTLWVTEAERIAMRSVLADCAD